MGEAGTVVFEQSSGAQWHTVTFEQPLDNPVVVMGGLTFEGSDPGTLRVRNVTDSGFEFQLDEWEYLDGHHTTETASWIAIEHGTHVLANGTEIRAGSTDVSGKRSEIDFDDDFGSTPIVLAQVTSDSDGIAVTERLQDVGASGFSVQLDRQESLANRAHGDETLDWIAIEATDGSSGPGVVVGRTGDVVNHARHTIEFDAFASDDFVFMADMQTRDGGDTANLRLVDSDLGSATVFVNEEKSRDQETGHASEDVGYMGIDAGLIYLDLLVA